MDVLDTGANKLAGIEIEALLERLPLWFKKAVMERDYEAEDALKRMNRWRQVWFADCQGLLENRNFTELMQKVLKTLDRVYGNPVDIEYTVNLDEQGAFVVNLLQCRPLYTGGRGTATEIPELPEKNVFFRLTDSSVGSSEKVKIDVVVEIDAKAYYEYPYALKPQAAEAGIFYCALWGDDRTVTYDRTFLEKLPDFFEKICPDRKELEGMFRVTEPEDLWYWNNEQTGETLCGRQPQAEKAPGSKA